MTTCPETDPNDRAAKPAPSWVAEQALLLSQTAYPVNPAPAVTVLSCPSGILSYLQPKAGVCQLRYLVG